MGEIIIDLCANYNCLFILWVKSWCLSIELDVLLVKCGSSLLGAGSLVPRIGSQDARGSKVVALGAGRDVAGGRRRGEGRNFAALPRGQKKGSLPSGLCSIYIYIIYIYIYIVVS